MSTKAYRDGWDRVFGPPTSEERRKRFKRTTGAFGYMTKRGPTGANHHPDRCECQKNDKTPHQHYDDPPHSCARCLECQAYKPVNEVRVEAIS